jgi:transposase
MSLQPTPPASVPAETARVARAAFPKGHPYLKLRDTFGTLFHDAQFQDLFSLTGQPAEAPFRLALVTLLQFAEHLSDRQAAEAVRARLDWKYLLGLELTDPGFDASVLAEFRARLLQHGAEQRLLELLLAPFREHGLLKPRGRQRTDSTHVLAAVRQLNRLELVGEAFRQALNALAVAAPEWLRPHLRLAWAERYGRCLAEQTLPRSQAERAALARTFGADGFALLAAVEAPTAPAWLRELPAVVTLRTVWEQQYEREPGPGAEPGPTFRWREAGEFPAAPEYLVSPTDPEARYSEKRSTAWVGYKVHFTESCDPEQPHLITDVLTTPAPVPDQAVLPEIQERLRQRDLLPGEHLVDAAYVDAASLVQSQQQGTALVGPPPGNSSWQARAGAGFAAEDFQVDWEAQQVQCPLGRTSVRWQEKEERGRTVIRVHFARQDCAGCAGRAHCTRDSDRGRLLTLLPRPQHEALARARVAARTAEFRAVYRARAGIEGTHAQAIKRSGVRHCRYLGEAKTRLQHVATAAALNLVRAGYWLLGTPLARTRQDAFVRLLAGSTA